MGNVIEMNGRHKSPMEQRLTELERALGTIAHQAEHAVNANAAVIDRHSGDLQQLGQRQNATDVGISAMVDALEEMLPGFKARALEIRDGKIRALNQQVFERLSAAVGDQVDAAFGWAAEQWCRRAAYEHIAAVREYWESVDGDGVRVVGRGAEPAEAVH